MKSDKIKNSGKIPDIDLHEIEIFCEASETGKIEIMKAIIEKCIAINALNANGRNALHYAAEEGRLDIVKLLVENGADVNIDGKDWTKSTSAIELAANGGHLAIFQFLLENGTNLESKDIALQEINLFCAAAGSGKLEVVEQLIKKGIDINAFDTHSSNALLCAARKGRLDIVKFLLAKGADIECKDDRGETLLLKAVPFDKKAIEILLDNQADINAIDQNGYTVTHINISIYYSKDSLGILKLLIERGAPINTANNLGQTPLHQTITSLIYHLSYYKKALKSISYLIEKGADINAGILGNDYRSGDTPLHLAVKHYKLELVKFLIDKGANKNAKNGRGETPLYAAIHSLPHSGEKSKRFKLKKIIQFLLENDVDLVLQDEDGYTPLHLSTYKDFDLVKLLIDKGADKNARNKKGNTPLHAAIQSMPHQKEKSKYSKKKKIIQTLLENDVDIRIKNNLGSTPFHLAIESGKLEIINLLLTNGSDVNEKGKFGFSAIHYATKTQNLKILQFLLKKGLDINQKDDYGFTPLHHASFDGDTKTATFLIQKGADCKATDNYGNSPLHYAAREGRLSQIEKENPKQQLPELPSLKVETIKLLIENGANLQAKNNKGETPLALAIHREHKEIVEFLKSVVNG
jgi:ankyrin repeat protein